MSGNEYQLRHIQQESEGFDELFSWEGERSGVKRVMEFNTDGDLSNGFGIDRDSEDQGLDGTVDGKKRSKKRVKSNDEGKKCWRFEDEDNEESYQRLRSKERKRSLKMDDYVSEYASTTEYGNLIHEQRLLMVEWIAEIHFVLFFTSSNEFFHKKKQAVMSLQFQNGRRIKKKCTGKVHQFLGGEQSTHSSFRFKAYEVVARETFLPSLVTKK